MYGRIKRIVLSKLNTKRRICPLCTGIRAKLLPYFAHSDSTTDMPHGLQELAAKSRIMLLQRYHAFFLTSKIIRASSLVKALSQEAAGCCINICTYMYIYEHTCTYADIPTYMDVWLLTIYLSIYPSMQKYIVCEHVMFGVCVCVCVCVCVKRTYVCIHAYILSYHII